MNLLFELLNRSSVSGFEKECSDIFLKAASSFSDDCYIDSVGNAIARIKGRSNSNILIEAHIDEIGYQVIHIDNSGMIYLRGNGGVDVQCMLGKQVEIHTFSGHTVSGVTGKCPIHMRQGGPEAKDLKLSDIWIDTGLSSDEVNKLISVGDVAVLASKTLRLGDHRITARGLDNKIGVFVIHETLKQLSSLSLQSNVFGVASVQEEVGGGGASVAAYNINPDFAIIFDVDLATDYPGCSATSFGDIRLGKGVIIPRNLDSDINLSFLAEKIAKENGTPFQLSACYRDSGGNNTHSIRRLKGGVRTLFLGIPCRYLHTPVEMIDLRDVRAAIDLTVNLIKRNFQ